MHTPAGFERFALSIGIAIDAQRLPPAPTPPVDPGELARVAAHYGIEILGPHLLP